MRVFNFSAVRRLPLYHSVLRDYQRSGLQQISTQMLAKKANMATPVVKKDIEMTGATGKTGVGYDIVGLIGKIETFLGWDNPNDAFLVGAGRLGSALMAYEGFSRTGLNIVAAFDIDPSRIGSKVRDINILPLDKMVSLAKRMHVATGILTVPENQAQQVADLLVTAEIKRIWNFSPCVLQLPPDITLQREDLCAGLSELMLRAGVQEKQNPKPLFSVESPVVS
ncbi:MAG: redox-sensing transcriptional repressor Rex [Planctomycetota bacterium]|jgi:redox-sensing transcriptional repressor|nr:redox-sensing transcriptional repressor Rex [Planctomycetota bacterium]